jgi:hypothetical protein
MGQLVPLHNGKAMDDKELMQLEQWTPPSHGVMVLDYVSYVYPYSKHGGAVQVEFSLPAALHRLDNKNFFNFPGLYFPSRFKHPVSALEPIK